MCDPFSIISAGLSIAGSLVHSSQQAAYVDAQNAAQREAAEISSRARKAELERQAQFEKEGVKEWDSSLANLTPDQQKSRMDEAQQNFQTDLEARPNSNDGMTLSGQDLAGGDFQQELVRQVSSTAADTRQRVANLAKLGAYGNVQTGNTIGLQNTNNSLNTLNGLRRGSLGASQWEQSIPAAQVSPGSSMLGDILSGAGSMVGGMGGGGGGGGTTVRPKGIY
jgi:hypothetical protein